MFSFKNLSTVFINHISKFIGEITSAVNSSSSIVNELSPWISHWSEISISILINWSNYICYIKSSTIIVEKLWEIAILSKLGLVKLLTPLVVNDISIFVESVTTGCNLSTSSINESVLCNMIKDWISIGIKFEIILKWGSIFVNEDALTILF